MRVLHTIEGFDAQLGGLASCTYELLSAFDRRSVTVDLLSPGSRNPRAELSGRGEPWINIFKNDCLSPIRYTSTGKRLLKESTYELYHINGLWQYINHITCRIARERGVPYVITPHGMLYPEALRRSGWKKQIVRKLWFDKDISNAACLHATCITEMDHIREFGYKGPIAVIANPINIPDYSKELFDLKIGKLHSDDADKLRSKDSGKVLKLGFLGRLHPIKRIENILYGAAKVKNTDFEIHIIGSGLPEYEEFLKSESERLGISDRTHFRGFLTGYDKFAAISELSLLFLPSEMENFGMIVPEALSVGTPVMASTGTPWQSLEREHCGWWNKCTPTEIADAISMISAVSAQEQERLMVAGRAFVFREFEASGISTKMLMLYEYLLDQSDKPDFVYEN